MAIGRQQHERDQRELPAREQEQGRGRDQRRAVLRDEDEPVAEEHAHRADVARRAREQLAGLVLVVEAEGHALQVRVERLPQVVLDVQREPARDQAPRDHERAADRARPDDQPDPEPQARAVVRPDGVVDRPSGEARDREREGLRRRAPGRSTTRAGAVRRGEAEQAAERARGCRCGASSSLRIRRHAGQPPLRETPAKAPAFRA